MSHARVSIRAAVITLLTGLTTTKANVFDGKNYSLSNDDLPALKVYTGDEQSELAEGDGTLDRELDLHITGYAKTLDDIEKEIDTICEEVEAAMNNDYSIGGLVDNSYLTSTTPDISVAGEKPVAKVEMIYTIKYTT